VVVYGGALHNDLHPDPLLANFAFGAAIHRQVAGRYLEVDLYVPEYVESSAAIKREPWYPLWTKDKQPGKALLIRRSAHSYIILFPETAPSPKARDTR
jgi:hypothetical protein